MSKSRPPLPPFSFESAVQKVRQAEDDRPQRPRWQELQFLVSLTTFANVDADWRIPAKVTAA